MKALIEIFCRKFRKIQILVTRKAILIRGITAPDIKIYFKSHDENHPRESSSFCGEVSVITQHGG